MLWTHAMLFYSAQLLSFSPVYLKSHKFLTSLPLFILKKKASITVMRDATNAYSDVALRLPAKTIHEPTYPRRPVEHSDDATSTSPLQIFPLLLFSESLPWFLRPFLRLTTRCPSSSAPAHFPPPAHYGTKPGHFETSKIHFPASKGVSEVSEQANK